MKTKRLFSAILAACLTLALILPASAAGTAPSLDDAVQAVTALGILNGDGSGNLNLSARVTRAEFVTMTVKAMPGGDGVGQAAVAPYPDVPRSHWASGYVEAAVGRRLISGFSDGTFRPDQEIKLAEAASMLLSLLGYGPDDFSGAFPTGQLAMCQNLKLTRGVTALQAASPLTRQDAVYLFYNLLSAKTKEGAPYIQQLGHSLDASGKPDVVALVNGQMEGPVVVQGYGWQSSLGFTPNKVYRNGSAASLTNIQDYDVVYWNAAMSTVWAYAKKATGPIQALAPSSAEPTSVTVAGRTYAIESSAAAYTLSDLGQYHLGSTVTLLLGRSGGVAAVADVSASAGERVGVVTAIEKTAYPDGSGGSYTAQTVTLLATDGQTYQYQTRGGYKVGSVVRAIVAGSGGEVTLRGLGNASLSGKVNREGTKLDKYAFAQGAEILDVSEDRGAVIYPARLAGLNLNSGKVKYYALNPQGEIETLILNDVTGDAYQYGIITHFTEEGEGMSRYCTYQYDVDGVSYTLSGATRFLATAGPIRIQGDPASPEKLYALTAAQAGQVSGNQFVTGNQRYTLSDSVVVYEYRDGRYYLSSLARAEGGGTVTAWYDKAESEGGRVRVIVVK
ncbi:MAG: S-layer homology domain-containing protein [Lawsonibacter sp.]|nr:S-layer homology domain-containing protein [Lawsonibacter sp.]